jgi:hypothetical protein
MSMPLANRTNADWSLHHQDLDVPVAHVLLVTDQEQIDSRHGHREMVHPQLTQRDRQVQPYEVNLRLGAVDL